MTAREMIVLCITYMQPHNSNRRRSMPVWLDGVPWVGVRIPHRSIHSIAVMDHQKRRSEDQKIHGTEGGPGADDSSAFQPAVKLEKRNTDARRRARSTASRSVIIIIADSIVASRISLAAPRARTRTGRDSVASFRGLPNRFRSGNGHSDVPI